MGHFETHPAEIPHERSTTLNPNLELLTPHLRHALKEGELMTSDFAKWPTEPWLAWYFLEGRVSHTPEAVDTNPANPMCETFRPEALLEATKRRSLLTEVVHKILGVDLLQGLRDWAAAGREGDAMRLKWEADHGKLASAIRKAITEIHDGLAPKITVFEKTQEQLHVNRSTNIVENLFGKTKEYVVDEIKEHPLMSVGLVLAAYWGYKQLKGTRMGKFLKWGVIGAIIASFAKNKFGIQPTEKLAEIAERFGMQGAADTLRTTRDSIKRGLFGAEDEGSLTGFYYEKLELSRDQERLAFNFMLQQNPKKFRDWYNAAKQWNTNRQGTGANDMPPEVSGLVALMVNDSRLPPYFRQMALEKQVDLLLSISDHTLTYIASRNGGGNALDGMRVLQQKYIDGRYFDLLWDRHSVFLKRLSARYPEDPAIQAQVKRIYADAEHLFRTLGRNVQIGSDDIDFMVVLLCEAEPGTIEGYKGAGISSGDMDEAWKSLKEKLTGLGEKGEEIWEYTVEYWTSTAKEKELWEHYTTDTGAGEEFVEWSATWEGRISGTSLTLSDLRSLGPTLSSGDLVELAQEYDEDNNRTLAGDELEDFKAAVNRLARKVKNKEPYALSALEEKLGSMRQGAIDFFTDPGRLGTDVVARYNEKIQEAIALGSDGVEWFKNNTPVDEVTAYLVGGARDSIEGVKRRWDELKEAVKARKLFNEVDEEAAAKFGIRDYNLMEWVERFHDQNDSAGNPRLDAAGNMHIEASLRDEWTVILEALKLKGIITDIQDASGNTLPAYTDDQIAKHAVEQINAWLIRADVQVP